MTISKALMLATQNGEKYSEIYSAVSDKKTFQDLSLNENEKENLIILTDFVDEQLREIILKPLHDLKKNNKRFHITNKKDCRWDHLINWEKTVPCIYMKMKGTTSSFFFYIMLCQLIKKDIYDIGLCIAFSELEKIKIWDDRKVIEEEICNILGPEWITSNRDYFTRRKSTASEDDLKNDFKTIGGYVTYNTPIVLDQNDEIKDIQNKIVEVGKTHFIKNIKEIQKYWQGLYHA